MVDELSGRSAENAQGVFEALMLAKMISPLADKGEGQPASFVTRRFTLPSVSGDEVLHVSAFGLYRCFINGQRVGEDLLTPGWTVYDKRLAYQTYPVGDLLIEGENTLEIWLADGWYRSQLLWRHQAIFNVWGDRIGAIAALCSGPSHDAAAIVQTDESWQSGELPIRRSGIYFGEIYDARLEGRSADQGVEALDFDHQVLVAQESGPVRELPALDPIKSWTDAEGRTLYDFGQNCGGYVAYAVRGAAGARVLVEHSEILDGEGRFENANYRTAKACTEYILKGEGVEHYRPTFTFQGFRYARVTIEGEAEITEIRSIPISSAVDRSGYLDTSNPLVNRLVENTVWSQRSNFIDVPTDCPQRDERLGWTGDAQVFAATSCYLFESHAFWRKWLRDVMADQREDGAIAHFSPDPTRLRPDAFPNAFGSTGWGDAICILPWTLYQFYGDRDVIVECLPAMVRWVDYVWSISDGPVVQPPGWGQQGFSFGDWLQPKGTTVKPRPTIGDDAAATIYLYIACDLTAKMADLIDEIEIGRRMRQRADEVKQAFQDEFVTATGRVAYNDQTSYALALLHDLVPQDLVPQAVERFRETIIRAQGRIGTGFIGTPALLPSLVKCGEYGLAAHLLLQEESPGWLYQVKRGATTIWERWDAIQADGTVFHPGMNSFNHYAYGAVCEWLFAALAGFRPDPENPGFKHIYFEPAIIPELGPVNARYTSVAGEVTAGWRVEGDIVTYELDVPQGAQGTLVLTSAYELLDIDGVETAATVERGKARSPLAPGRHVIRFRISRPVGKAFDTVEALPEPTL